MEFSRGPIIEIVTHLDHSVEVVSRDNPRAEPRALYRVVIRGDREWNGQWSAITITLPIENRPRILPGDFMWYDSGRAYWTPASSRRKEKGSFDIPFERTGYDSVVRFDNT